MILDEIAALHASGIECYVRGDHDRATADWVLAAAIARWEAASRGLDLGTRFLRSESWTNGIGHIALLDFFAKRRILGLCADRHVVVTRADMIANPYYLGLWRRYFDFVEAEAAPIPDADLLQEWPMVLDVGGLWLPMMIAVERVERMWHDRRGPPLVAMPPADIARGWARLAEIGIPAGRWFATFHVREGGAVSGTVDDLTSIRNADLADYAGAVAAVVEAGGHPIRIGRAQALTILPGLIDMGGLSPDWFDVFLLSQCRLFIGLNSGPAWVAGTFGAPSLLTNWAPSAVGYGYAGARILHKTLIVDGEVGRSLAEKLTYIESAAILKSFIARAVPNSPASIEGAVVEYLRDLPERP